VDFKQIEAFVYVVKYKSFSKAADAIYLTQPTVSAHVSSLENELGIKLIDRSGKDIYLSKAGKLFYEYAINMLNSRDHAVCKIREFARDISGTLEVVASTVPAQYLLPELLVAFRKCYSDINFIVHQSDSAKVAENILESGAEIGITGSIIEDEKLVYENILNDKLVLIVPNNKRFQSIDAKDIDFNPFLKEPFILREEGSGTRKEFEKFLRSEGIDCRSLNIIALMNSTEAVKQAVSQGLGISIISRMAVEDYERFELIKVLDIESSYLERNFYLTYHKNRTISPVTEAFKEFIRKFTAKKSH
jgi:DNA-binding transcriptional LysR family regulator